MATVERKPLFGIFPRKPKHVHEWKCIKTIRGQRTGAFAPYQGPVTIGHWKCQDSGCGKIDVVEHQGWWTPEELNA